MKSIIVKAHGGPEVMRLENIEKPTPTSNQVLIKVEATSVTVAHPMMRTGTPYFGRLFTGISKPNVKSPGTDLAGSIEAVGENVKNFQVGDQVLAATDLKMGAYSEYICLPEDGLVVHKPENVDAAHATGIIDGGITALAFFTDQVTVNPGDKVLINGASRSIGTAAVQLAKTFGAEVTGVCSGKNVELVKELGADEVLDYTKNELEQSEKKFDIIFDTVGKLSYRKSKKKLTEKGVFLTPVLEMPTLLTMLFLNPFSKQKLKFAATGMRKKELRMQDLKRMKEMLASEKIRTVIDKVFVLEDMEKAHAYVDQGHKRGNVIVKMP
ncbi:MAG: NAD(P)-dependent alcohol dehydrogenase [Crocinitomicaceae bacterium]